MSAPACPNGRQGAGCALLGMTQLAQLGGVCDPDL